MLEYDIEKALLDHLTANVDLDPKFIHYPGETFSPERRKEWIEPRIVSIERDPNSRSPMEEFAAMDFVVRCFVKVLQKGDRRGELSKLVDKVRAVIDAELRVNAAIIRDEDKADIGRIQWGVASTARLYGVNVTIDNVEVTGVDVATIATRAHITGDP